MSLLVAVPEVHSLLLEVAKNPSIFYEPVLVERVGEKKIFLDTSHGIDRSKCMSKHGLALFVRVASFMELMYPSKDTWVRPFETII